MPETPDFSVVLATEVAKQVPVKAAYDDAASPAMKQAGGLLEDTLKTIRLALFPLQIGAVAQERFREFIERAKTRVPEEHLVMPYPQILGPTLEGIKYSFHDDEITEMFSSLLSRAMDKNRMGEAHPSFVTIIRQLSPDEAKILFEMSKNPINIVFVSREENKSYEFDHLEVAHIQLAYPENSQFYADRFFTLGLLDYLPGVDEHFDFGELKAYRKRLILSRVGSRLIRACTEEASSSGR